MFEDEQSLQTFARRDGVLPEPNLTSDGTAEDIPPPPKSVLPPPGDLHLQVNLNQYITHGSHGIFYTVTTSLPHDSSGDVCPNHPPLVAKIALPEHNEDLWREMALYKEMESIQGVVVARCYGLFEGIVRDSMASILPPYESDDDSDDASEEQNFANPRPLRSEVRRPSRITGPVSIILFEQLGGHLPIREPLAADTKKQIKDMYNALEPLAIEHDYKCIMSTWHVMSALPPQPDNTYKFRLLDFTTSQRTNMRPDQYEAFNKWVDHALACREAGEIDLS